ncbi:MFS general substrate transporter [Suillus paluster]|uniref:MFS general substrate transporter n=1 Tax=Suillus paluster TaxID=48578 RepID=UPI001B864D6B|nr:MFS general substrate transporter [Suillus paluster]KAG1739374.1 MFS general substrate transporter [Suillus paluster]
MSARMDEKRVDTTDAIDDLPTVPCHARDGLERRLVRKLDLRMSVIVVIYTLNFIDRTNVNNARLQGFEKDLHLHGEQYATVLSILYVGYIIMQVPGNMLLHRLGRPAILIPSCMAVWGMISVLTGITTNYTGVLVVRFFLGFVEAPFFPGVLFLVSRWYKRDEIAMRTGLVSCGSILSFAFGSLIASGILSSMEGKLGQAAWRWLFYIEGGITIIVAIFAIFILPDFPHNTRWLTPEERALAISRLAEDRYGTAEELGKQTTIQGLRDAVSDWKVWWVTGGITFQYAVLSFASYFPTIAATMGYGTTVTLLLCAPPWAFAAIAAFFIVRHSDKKQKRYRYLAACNGLGSLGFIVSICTMNTVARYISLFLMAQIIGGYMVLWGWISNTFDREPAKRAVAIALISALGQLGSIAGSYIWPSNWGPTYRYSSIICIAAIAMSTSMFGMMHLYLKHQNVQIERNERDAKDVKELRDPIGFRYLV